MVLYANEVETKKKKKLPEITKLTLLTLTLYNTHLHLPKKARKIVN